MSAAPDTAAELRSLIQAGWAWAFVAHDRGAVSPPLQIDPALCEHHLAGPPPPFGVDLLHRLNVLVC